MRINIGDKNKFSKTVKELFDLNIPANQFNGISIDSRNIYDGDVFIAMRGENVDSHNFIDSKLEASTSLIVNEQEKSKNKIKVSDSKKILGLLAMEYRKKMECKVVGITGSNGKTTTKEILFHILNSQYSVSMTPGNYNSTIGMPMSFFSISSSNDIFIAEMGINSIGEMKYLSEIAKPDLGLITNISEAHIQNFKSVEEIYNEKVILLESLQKTGVAFLNMDDSFISTTQLINNAKIIKYGFNDNYEYSGNYQIEGEESFFINNCKVDLNFHSINLMKNILAAFSIASELGIDFADFNTSISTFNIPNGRGNIIDRDDYIIIDDTYNSNFASTVAGITSLCNQKYKHKRKLIILGDMLELGDKANQFHEKLLEHIIHISNCKIFTYGKLMKYLYEKSKTSHDLSIEHFEDQKLLIKKLNDTINKGDVLYVKGSRGMKMENIIRGLY